MEENKQEILDKLCVTLKLTRDQHSLTRIDYERFEDGTEIAVLSYEGNGKKSINISMDSGIAMIRDITRYL